MSSSITTPSQGGGVPDTDSPLGVTSPGHIGVAQPIPSSLGGTGTNQGDASVATPIRALAIADGDGEKSGFANANGITEVNVTALLTVNSVIFFTHYTINGSPGTLYQSSIDVDGVSFGFKSTSATDTSVIYWWIVERYVP